MIFEPDDPHSWMAYHAARKMRQRPNPRDGMERFHEWNWSARFFTDDTQTVKKAVEQAQFRHRHAALGSRSAVIIDGPPLAGKTDAALAVALSQTIAAHSAPLPQPYSHHLCPWAYVEAANQTGQLSVAKTIARQIRVIETGLRSAPDYLAAIRHLAPRVGLQGLIIDDSHAMKGARSASTSTTLATTLKGLITGVPTTTVIIGANLARDNILTGTTGEQVRMSAREPVVCGRWPHPDGRVITGWERLVKQARDQLALPDDTSQFRLGTRKTVLLLAEGSQGRPGRAIQWIKDAAEYAIKTGTHLDEAALEATADGIAVQASGVTP